MDESRTAGSVTNAMHNLTGENHSEAETHLYRSLCGSLLATLSIFHGKSLKSDVDLSQVVNDAIHCLLTGIPEGKFPWLKNRTDLRKLAFTIAIRLLRQSIRSSKAIKRGQGKQLSIDEDRFRELVEVNPNDPVERCIQAEAEANLDELFQNLLNSLRDVDNRAIEIVKMSLSGLTNNQIADQLGLRLRRVQQLKKSMEDRVLKFLNEAD